MKILVDTQCWLWMLAEPGRFSPKGKDLVATSENELLLSAVSAWEIAIKCGLGKLRLPGLPAEVVPGLMEKTRMTPLPIRHSHALRVAELPLHHRDPFDRLLIAQAQVEGLPILTADQNFALYDVEVLSPQISPGGPVVQGEGR